jgi:Spy/CpxP family protein refolding chaperone
MKSITASVLAAIVFSSASFVGAASALPAAPSTAKDASVMQVKMKKHHMSSDKKSMEKNDSMDKKSM